MDLDGNIFGVQLTSSLNAPVQGGREDKLILSTKYLLSTIFEA